MDGSFSIGGKHFTYDIIEVITEDGASHHGGEHDDQILNEVDQVFYKISMEGGGSTNDFYRWLAGPFESLDSIYEAIEDEAGEYQDLLAGSGS